MAKTVKGNKGNIKATIASAHVQGAVQGAAEDAHKKLVQQSVETEIKKLKARDSDDTSIFGKRLHRRGWAAM